MDTYGITGDMFMDNMDRKTDILEKIQTELQQASEPLIKRMAKGIGLALNKSMDAYVEDPLAHRKLNFMDQISIKHQTMPYEQIQFGFLEELEARIDAQIESLSSTEWLVFQFRDASLYYEKGKDAVILAVKKDVLAEFSHILDEHFNTKRVQLFIERYPWLING